MFSIPPVHIFISVYYVKPIFVTSKKTNINNLFKYNGRMLPTSVAMRRAEDDLTTPLAIIRAELKMIPVFI